MQKTKTSETESRQGKGGKNHKPQNSDLVMPSDINNTMLAHKQIQITPMEIKE